MTSPPSNQLPLDSGDARQLAAVVAELAGAGLPLPLGLRIVADEGTSRRLKVVLRELADRIEKGQSLVEAMEGLGNRVPTFVRELISSAARSGRLASVLNEFVENQQRTQDLIQETRRALAYPFIVLVLSLLVATLLPMAVVPGMATMYREFGVKLPPPTEAIVWFGEKGAYYFVIVAVIIGACFLILRVYDDDARWRSVVAEIPILGRIWYWSSVSQMCRLIGMLVESGLPLSLALNVAESGIDNAALRDSTHRLAQDINQGRNLYNVLRTTFYWPRSMIPFIEWGERTTTLPDAFRTVADIFAARAANRARWLQTVLPPFLFICVAFVALGTITSLIWPLIDLIGKLS